MKKKIYVWNRLMTFLLALACVFAFTACGSSAQQQTTTEETTEEETTTQDLEGKYVIACMGDSITDFGYPEVLQEVLGDGYVCLNFGRAGTCATEGIGTSYTKFEEYTDALAADADMYLILFGVNDVNTKNKQFVYDEAAFIQGYSKIVDSALGKDDQPQVILLNCSEVVYGDQYDTATFDHDALMNSVRPAIVNIAAERNLPVIDMYEITKDDADWTDDGLHPNDSGMQRFAEYIAENIKPYLPAAE